MSQGYDTSRPLWAGQERFYAAFVHSGIGMALVSPRGQWLDVNPAICNFLGYTEAELLKTDFQAITHSDDLHADLDRVAEMLAGKIETYSLKKRYIHKSGKILWGDLTVSLARDEKGHPLHFISQVQDVTERHLLEERMKRKALELEAALEAAQAADKAKNEFLAVMSHEIRTPMNAILGYASILQTTAVDNEQKSYLETIESSGERLLVLINDILDLSRIEAGRMKVLPASFCLHECVREVFELLRAGLGNKPVVYELKIAPELPSEIVTDRGRLAQILTNILGNAVKFTDSGSIRMTVEGSEAGAKWMWRFVVEDTGPGVPSQALAQIFEPFFQADSSSTRKHGGTGLGLPISRKLAQLLGGDIEAENLVGGGARFVLSFCAPAGDGSPVKASVNDATLKGRRILLVEDHEINRKLCELQLSQLGCAFDSVHNGSEALTRASREVYDAILMDIQLPEMDGYMATRLIRDLPDSLGDLPIIAMTANAMPGDRQRCLEAGMTDYVTKPLSLETLSAALTKWI